jgi:adenine deaminase
MGTNAVDMLNAVKAIDKHLGGFAVAAAGEVKQVLPMNIYGMMTNYPIDDLIHRSQTLDQSLNDLGHQKSSAAVNSLLEIFYLADRHGYL